MDLGRHSSSARMLFLGRHLNARLNFSHERQLSHVNASVLVSRAWDSLVHMEAAVISAFRKRLSAPPSTKEVLKCIKVYVFRNYAILLLLCQWLVTFLPYRCLKNFSMAER